MFSSESSISENSVTPIQEQSSITVNNEIEILLHKLFQEGCDEEEFNQTINIYEQEKYDFCDFLIEKDANGNTPIHTAARFDHVNPILLGLQHLVISLIFGFEKERALLAANSRNNDGKTPLHLAIEGGNLECVIALVDSNFYSIVDVNIQDNKGQMPIHAAVLSKNHKAIEKLLSVKNIDIEIADKNGNSVYDYVRSSTDEKIVNLFIEHYNSKAKEAVLERKNSDKAAKSNAYYSKICNNITIGFGAAGGLIELICESIFFVRGADRCECDTIVNKYKSGGIVFASIAAILLPFALLLHYRSSHYKEKHDLLSDDIEKYRTQTMVLDKVVEKLCRQNIIPPTALESIDCTKNVSDVSCVDLA